MTIFWSKFSCVFFFSSSLPLDPPLDPFLLVHFFHIIRNTFFQIANLFFFVNIFQHFAPFTPFCIPMLLFGFLRFFWNNFYYFPSHQSGEKKKDKNKKKQHRQQRPKFFPDAFAHRDLTPPELALGYALRQYCRVSSASLLENRDWQNSYYRIRLEIYNFPIILVDTFFPFFLKNLLNF